MIHIYCGDGKGKTSAAIGLAVRAAGRGRAVLIARFLKSEDSGEVLALPKIPGIRVMPCEKEFGFYFRMTEEQKLEAAEYYSRLFEQACEMARSRQIDVLILDELMAACSYRLVDEAKAAAFLRDCPADLEVVMTGRNPSEQLVGLADYVSEVVMKKHPYEQGVAAREGIEY